ncbi:phenylacetic acid degradation protein [Kordiimonas sediminis]|uniref:Phenylacetic acid degradation protein n=1 Tax=Kordiimonas sediminis TaxID=1735581 RepID=A0A919AJ42_9PROT|nr:2Fe-2S iron-sulfur cluster-binding protein [Kordiimonas sediminis]GHF11021.1 phenylacetic acid degradation protein [Kordiimonas sediminis]
MHQHHELTVSGVEKNTPETIVVTFDVPEGLRDAYQYKQGQHLTLIKDLNGEELRRSYSICSSVGECKLTVAIREVENGRFSTYANANLAVGDKIDVMTPTGHFYVDLDDTSSRTYAAFAAGSGITPLMSIIKTTLQTEPNARFLLFYGNRTGRSTIFRSEISDLKNRFTDRFSYWHFLSQEDLEMEFFNGRLDCNKTQEIFKRIISADKIDHAFVCGPDAMIDGVIEGLKSSGFTDKQIHSEKFLSEGQQAVAPGRAAEVEGEAEMTLVIDGDEFSITSSHSVAILDAAIEGDLDVPFACKGGVCCTCRAKVLEGDVEMVLNQGLEPEEVAAGYVLTCQSYAVSDKVVLSFDE